MSEDIRELLESQMEEPAAAPDTEQSPAENGVDEGEQNSQPPVDEYLNAPKSYKKEYADIFKDLSPEWRKYLHERESETEKGFSRLNNQLGSYKFLNDAFTQRQQKLSGYGINKQQEWIEQLIKIEDALESDPAATIKALAEAYGINNENKPSNPQETQYLGKIRQLEQSIGSLQQFVNQSQQESAQKAFESFIGAKDESGASKHPYFEDVREGMSALLSQGAAKDLEEAYEKAVWLNPEVREKVIAQRAQAELQAKAAEAQKAKAAAFSPKGKAVPEQTGLSLREELEKGFEALE